MYSKNRFSLNVCLAVVFAMLISSTALAQKDKKEERSERDRQKTRQAQAVSKEVFEKIEAAQELIDADDNTSALKILNRLYNPDKLTEYEQVNVLNYLGFVYYNMDDIGNAMDAYSKLLLIPSLEPQTAKQTTYTLAQLNMMEERYSRALELLNKWFILETNPAPDSFILKAQLMYQLQRYPDMIEPIQNAMQVARDRELQVKEDWYVLLNFAYFQQEDYAQVRDIQKILLENWPKKRYWFSLAGAFTELGEDQNLVAAYDAAYTQGMLEKESEFVTMAQLFLQREVPFKAATLLEARMEDGTIKKNEKNYRLLSQAWQLSQEDERAVPALTQAARLAEDGELDVRLGNAYLNLSEYNDCVSAVRTGIRKGGLRYPENAHISLGMCLYNLRQYSDAKKAFRQAAKVEKSRRVANQWLRVIDAEIERNRQIRLAQEAARKKREEVDARRAASSRA
jgi:tetratricopeptide (TPR) repeat protein